MTDATIYALASGRPPAAISIIRVSGSLAHATGRRLAGELPEARRAGVRSLRSLRGELLDHALLLRFDAPASSTGEDMVELHCHGSRAVVDAVLYQLGTMDGLRRAMPGEFTRRAFENGRIDLTEAEGLADLLQAETETQRKAALLLAQGGLRRKIEAWGAMVLELSARAEAAIDYVDDSDVEGEPELARESRELVTELQDWLSRPRAEPLRDGIKVVLGGPPNAGKSSLLNAIAGSSKAIVTAVPGTTRDQIEVPVALDGVAFVFVDTAGLRDSGDPVERIGIDLARSAIRAADILLWLGEAADAPSHPCIIHVHSRADLPERNSVPPGSIPVSTVDNRGLGSLLSKVTEFSVNLLPKEGVVALNRRQAQELSDAADALARASASADIVIVAEELRSARESFHRVSGRAGIEDLLDQLFGRFCLGK